MLKWVIFVRSFICETTLASGICPVAVSDSSVGSMNLGWNGLDQVEDGHVVHSTAWRSYLCQVVVSQFAAAGTRYIWMNSRLETTIARINSLRV